MVVTGEEGRRVEDLWTRYVARETLTPEERAELAAALEGDEIFRRRMMNDLQLDGALRAVSEADRVQDRVVASVKALVLAAARTEEVVAAVRKRIEAKAAGQSRFGGATSATSATSVTGKRRLLGRPLVVASALLAAAAAALLLFGSPTARGPASGPLADREAAGERALPGEGNGGDVRGDRNSRWAGRSRGAVPAAADRSGERVVIARLEALDGAAYRHGPDGILRAAPALELAAGDWVSTSGGTARARVVVENNRIDLAGDAVFALSGGGGQASPSRLFLAHGRATAVLAGGRSGTLSLASPHASVSGQGTVRLDVGHASTRVEVREGKARVAALGVQRGTDVEAGQLALVSAEDLQPPRAQAAPREALLLIGPDDTKEEPPASGQSLRGSEQRLKARLERLGFLVVVADAATLQPEQARTATVIVFSSSVSSQLLAPWYSELPVPMIVLESTGFEQLGLIGSRWRRDLGSVAPLTEVVITNPDHPLAGGLSGSVRVMSTPLNMRWVAPPPSATVIASYAGAAAHACLLFGYERGALMSSGLAPARRVGLFLGNGRIVRALTEQGWRLFDAAVLWAAG